MNFQAPDSLSEQIAQHLGKKIICGALKPKERIQELKIAGELDVSRGSVREALLILERRHLINIYPRRGAVVSALSAELISSLYDMYIYLLIMLGNKLADKWQGHDLRPMLEQLRVVNRMAEAADTPLDEFIDAGFELITNAHQVVENPYLEETLANFRPAIARTYYLSLSRRRDEKLQTVRFYNDLVVSVQSRESVKINRVIKVYGDHQRALVLGVLQELTDAAAMLR